jgi:2-polyprenyl-3-methyl-5-hydroxy-6-metoxy-1,4-benzoquinol methylase
MKPSEDAQGTGISFVDDLGGYDSGYRSSPCFWGREPGSLLPASLDFLPQDFAGLRVLDAGCGEGKNSVFFAKRGATVHAVDISPAAIENAQRAWSDVNHRVMFEVGDVQTVPLSPTAYDVVILYGLLHCLSSTTAMKALATRLMAATKPRGLHIVCALNSRRDGFTEGHPIFRPRLAAHDFYTSLYTGSELAHLSDSDLTESHPPDHRVHTHAVTRFIARLP